MTTRINRRLMREARENVGLNQEDLARAIGVAKNTIQRMETILSAERAKVNELTLPERNRLTECETIIEKGLQTFVEVGIALAEIRESRLYRLTHGTFEEYCGERWGFTSIRAKQLMESAVVAKNIETVVSNGVTESHLRPLKNLQPEQQREVYQRSVETAPNGKVTAAHVEATVKTFQATIATPPPTPQPPSAPPPAPVPAKPHVTNNSGNNEWYTPAPLLAAARKVLDNIDLDPASCEIANEVVKADEYYDIDDDGLSLPWAGRIWLNPPYAGDLIGRFVAKLIAHIATDEVTEAIVLVNNATETAWFQDLAGYATAVCFPKGRIRYWNPDREDALSPLQGQAIVYIGPRAYRFRSEFLTFGVVL